MTTISKLSGLGCGVVLLIVFLISTQTTYAQFSDAERAALVALYNATDGDNWINNDKWLTEYGIDRWYGIQVIQISRSSRRVYSIDLSGNNLRGKIPSNLGELYDLTSLNVANNPGLSGTLPVELVNLNSLDTFLFDGTNLCESTYSGFQSWIGAVPNVSRTGCLVPTDEGLIGTCERSTAEADLDANNVRAHISNVTGLFSTDKYEVPRADSSTVLYGGNLWFAGIVDGTVRASAGRYYTSELWPGPLDDQGAPPFDCDPYDRIYKISTSDLSAYENTGFATQDLRQWPSGLGAPTVNIYGERLSFSHLPFSYRNDRFIDLDAGERPQIQGDQTLWWLMNDRGNDHYYGFPLGLEVHALAFASYSFIDAVTNSTLYTFRIINRNTKPITDAYVGLFIGPVLGSTSDDFVGSDSARGMAYVYNSDNSDPYVNSDGLAPPAVGYFFLEGPSSERDQLDNDSDGAIDEPGERLRTTAVVSPGKGTYITGHSTTARHFYYYMQGRWKDGKPITVGGEGRDFSKIPTKYMFSGDPVTGSYWSQLNTDSLGTERRPGYRRLVIASGPFALDPGEETDYTIAFVWARGKDHLDSITELRRAADQVRLFYGAGGFETPFMSPQTPTESPDFVAALAHNYPNPFSEQTTIRFRVPQRADVRLIVYDVLGREVVTLIDEPKDAGEYSVVFDGNSKPTGIYFFRLQIDHASGTRRMVLIW